MKKYFSNKGESDMPKMFAVEGTVTEIQNFIKERVNNQIRLIDARTIMAEARESMPTLEIVWMEKNKWRNLPSK